MGTPSGTLRSTGLKTTMLNITLVLAGTTMLNTSVLHDLQVLKLCIIIITGTRACYRHFTCRLPQSGISKLMIGIKADGGRTDEKANQISLGQ
jgi:hypothetical protein